MSDALYNASAVILKPEDAVAAANAYQRTHAETAQAAVRCSFRAMSRSAEALAFGNLAVDARVIRLHSTLAIAPGWRVTVTEDGSNAVSTWIVRRVRKQSHFELIVERA